MSRSYTSSPPQAPPWRVAGLLCFDVTEKLFYVLQFRKCQAIKITRPFQVLTAASMTMIASWDIALCSLVEVSDVSEVRTASIIRAIMKALHTYEISAYFNETTRRYIPEDNHLHIKIIVEKCIHFSGKIW
jgi:hypothetical protein